MNIRSFKNGMPTLLTKTLYSKETLNWRKNKPIDKIRYLHITFYTLIINHQRRRDQLPVTSELKVDPKA
jgi:hypothetical protein